MTAEDRVSAVAEFGFTPRQARFLALVMRHAGVCLLRQYSRFAGIVHGQKTRAFFHKLVSHQYASAYACRHNRGRLYHVHHFSLYRATDEPNSAYRRPVTAARVSERLLVLDSVLANAKLDWLATAAEKVAHFTQAPCSVPLDMLPRLTARTDRAETGSAFPDRMPIGIGTDGRAVFLYLVLPTIRDDFRAFLRRHAPLFERLPSWTLQLVFPRAIAHAYAGFQTVIHDEFESPLHVHTVEELRWYFEQVRAVPRPESRPSDERFLRAAEAFERPRFYPLYKRWLKEGDRSLEDVSSTVISDALAAGVGRVECLVLPYRYDHLSPLVNRVGSTEAGAEKGAEKCDQRGEHTPAPPRPPFSPAKIDAINSSSLDCATADASATP
jgi:hypothetical protein